NNAGGLVSNNTASFRVQAALQTQTDSKGQFSLPNGDNQTLNVEAVLSEDVKAIQLNVTNASTASMQLANVGSIRGHVKSSQAGVTDLLGVDVFIPGTGYLAKTDQTGNYEISFVPPGKFPLVATHADLGRGALEGVSVVSKQVTQA